MSSYVTESDILSLMPQLPRTGTSGYTATSAMIGLILDSVDSLINGHVVKKYSLPFSVVPTQLRSIAKELSVYNVYKKMYHADNMVRNSYVDSFNNDDDNAYKKLEKIGEGNIWLTLTNGSEVTRKTTGLSVDSTTKDYQSLFDMDSVTSHCVDSDLISEISEAR